MNWEARHRGRPGRMQSLERFYDVYEERFFIEVRIQYSCIWASNFTVGRNFEVIGQTHLPRMISSQNDARLKDQRWIGMTWRALRKEKGGKGASWQTFALILQEVGPGSQ